MIRVYCIGKTGRILEKRKSDLENWQRDQHLFVTTPRAIHQVQIVTPVGVHQNFP